MSCTDLLTKALQLLHSDVNTEIRNFFAVTGLNIGSVIPYYNPTAETSTTSG
jgi:hypothetical protein